MSETVARLVAEITADTSGLEKGTEKSKQSLQGVEKGAIDSGMALKAMGGLAVSAAIATVNYLASAEKEAAAAAQTHAKLEAVLKATGYAAGLNAGQIDDMTNSLAMMNGVDDEVLKNSEAVLLTFRNIGGETFPRATQAMIDMSAVMGQDLQSSAVQLGKALNDPIAGISALSRIGVTFSDVQKEQIRNFVELGDVASAQSVILKEMESEFGGAAQKMVEAGDGSERLDLALGNLNETIGAELKPNVKSLKEYLASSAEGWTSFIGGLRDSADMSKRADELLAQYDETLYDAQGNVIGYKEATEEETKAVWEKVRAEMGMTPPLKANAEAAADAADETERLGKARSEFFSLLERAQSEMSSIDEQQADALQQLYEAQQKYEELKAQGYRSKKEGTVLGNAQEEIDKYIEKLDDLKEKEAEFTNRQAFDIFKSSMEEGGLTAEESNAILEQGLQLGIYDQKYVDTTKTILEKAEEMKAQFQDKADSLTANTEQDLKNYDLGVAGVQKYSKAVQDEVTIANNYFTNLTEKINTVPKEITIDVFIREHREQVESEAYSMAGLY